MLFMDEYNLPGVFYSAEELQEAQGDFTPSEFVKSVAGVDNVCERAAVLASGGKLTVKKKKNCAQRHDFGYCRRTADDRF